jgi:hypothetical protein
MTKYIKTGTTEFEQFDGSDEMCEKYSIRKDTEYLISDDPLEYQIAPYQIESLEGWLNLNVGDWIATGAEGEHWPVHDETFKKAYKKLPKLTRPVSRYLEYCKEHWSLNDAFLNAEYLVPSNGALEVFDYLSEHPDDFARAWLDGYEVVK